MRGGLCAGRGRWRRERRKNRKGRGVGKRERKRKEGGRRRAMVEMHVCVCEDAGVSARGKRRGVPGRDDNGKVWLCAWSSLQTRKMGWWRLPAHNLATREIERRAVGLLGDGIWRWSREDEGFELGVVDGRRSGETEKGWL